MNELQFAIPQEILTATIEAMRNFMLFLEMEAASLARLDSQEARELAQERLEDAKVVEGLYCFYGDL